MFQHIPSYLGDPILSIVEDFKQDPRPAKINLSIGLYYDEKGNIPVLPSVQESMRRLSHPPIAPLTYLPMAGYAPFIQAIQRLIVGEQHPILTTQRLATIQTVGSSGALRIGADFIKKFFPDAEVWISHPTWENHFAIFQQAGFKTHRYSYFDTVTKSVDFERIIATFEQLPRHAVVVLHACCHNPTGADLSPTQWDELLTLVYDRELIPFIDMAYQGLGDGLTEDSYAIHKAIELNLPIFISHSCSKIFSIYGERCGSLSVLCDDAKAANHVFGQLQATARANYSTPPLQGARIVSEILTNPILKQMWFQEVAQMRQRILTVREMLFNLITQHIESERVAYLLTQKGMFSYTNFSVNDVQRLRQERAIYLIQNGRICISGINDSNIETIANAMIAILAAH